MFLRFCIIVLVAVILLGAASCCSDGDETRSTIQTRDSLPTTGEEAPNDIMFTPGGVAYRANVHEDGEENPWPPIETTEDVLGSGFSEINVGYRNYIETVAGQIRNNILNVTRPGQLLIDYSLSLYSIDAPAGMELAGVEVGGLPGDIVTVLVMEVPPDVELGQYAFEIGLDIDGEDYGTIPCTIEVLTSE